MFNISSRLCFRLILTACCFAEPLAAASGDAFGGVRAPKSDTHPFLIHHGAIQGKISDGRYISYRDIFSIELPASMEYGQVEDFFVGPYVGGVAFYNDYGFFLKLEIDEIVPEVESLITKHPQIKGEILDAIFSEVLLRQLKESVSTLQVIDQKETTLAGGEPALFVVIKYPELGGFVNPMTGRPFDSNRGYLMFFAKDKSMISLSLQDTLSFIPSVAEAAKTSLSDRLLNHLKKYQSTFRLEPA